jgi:ribokinase
MSGIVTVVGSYAVGLTFRADRMPVGGETLLASDFDLGPGGKGSNQAIQAARMGASTQLVTVIGDDEFGRQALELWRAEGIHVGGVRCDPATPTGAGAILLDDAGENRILLFPGANAGLDAVALEDQRERIAAGAVVLTQLEISAETAAAALRIGREEGVMTILNPAPAQALPPEVLALADVLVPNESEARILTGRAPGDAVEDETLCAELLRAGARTVVLTCGWRGALVARDGNFESYPAPVVDVVDSTGAGDAFTGTLAAALAAATPLPDAVALAVRAGALACTRLGVIPGLPTRDQLFAEPSHGDIS